MLGRLKSFWLFVLLVFISQPVLALVPACHQAESGDAHAGQMQAPAVAIPMSSMENSEHSEDCCGADCEPMHCAGFLALHPSSDKNFGLVSVVPAMADFRVPPVADSPVPTPPPIFR